MIQKCYNQTMNKEKILSEIEKIKYLYRFKKIIRYSQKRTEIIPTESDAEHIFGMMILANYFLNTEFYKKENYNREKIYDLILFHEMDELELGDISTHLKTSSDIKKAFDSLEVVYKSIPENLRQKAENNFQEYNDGKTKEALFVFWLDKIEPVFHMSFDLKTSKQILTDMKLDREKAYEKKSTELKNSGLMKEFLDVLYTTLDECFYVEKK